MRSLSKLVIIAVSAAAFLLAPLSCTGEKITLSYVDPLIGTRGEGTQYGGMMPMTGVPFGSIQWVPMTRLMDVSRLSYNESDSTLLGFIGTRQPAIWMGDWGQVSFQPQTGELKKDYGTRAQKIENCRFTPYESEITAGGIVTRFAGTEHAAVFEFSDAGHIVIDASRIAYANRSNHAPLPGHIELGTDKRSVSGWNSDMFDGQHSTPKLGFKGYFHMEFSRSFVSGGVDGDLEDEVRGYVSFAGDGPLTLRIGVSLISPEDARRNLSEEIGTKDVKRIASEAKRKWQEKFDVLNIDATEDIKTIFYTGMYHAMLYPRRIDENGRYYSAFDDSVHEGVMYNCWSMWDTYRAEHPFLTLVAPERVDDMMQSLLEMYREGGWLPKWPNPGYTGIMAGAPAETILAEAWTKGFRGFDLSLAYEAVKKNATVPQPTDTVFRWEDRGCFGDTPETRGGLTRYRTIGYVAADETNESVSRTLDFGLQDRAAAILAGAAGFPEDSAYFFNRSFNYRNLWNAEQKLFLPRAKDGTWMDPVKGRHYCECSPQTALWCVPYDIDGVAGLIGGRDNYIDALDEFFATRFWKPERGNKSIHGNEPSHHVAYLYNRVGRPDKTQKTVREIMARSYSTERKGFDGNEDCGQMSSWYILSSLGLYMLNPADGWYELGSPCVKEATLKIGWPYRKATLRIIAENQSPENVYVRKVTFNGRELEDWRIHHSELIRGGELRFEMAPEPTRVKMDIQTIWDNNDHSAFTSIIKFKGRWYCSFREFESHIFDSEGRALGKVRVLASDDLKNWENVAYFGSDKCDLRDPKLSITPDGRLMVIMGGSYYVNREVDHKTPQVCFSDDGVNFSAPQPCTINGPTGKSKRNWIWRVTWHEGTGYAVCYTRKEEGIPPISLLKTMDGINYEVIKGFDDMESFPNETTVRFLPDGRMVMAVRRDREPYTMLWGIAEAPFTDWKFKDVGFRIGGPDILVLNSGEIFLAGRSYNPYNTTIWKGDAEGNFEFFTHLPSMPDCSYPGLAMDGEDLITTWYCRAPYTENHYPTVIRLARIPLTQ